MGLGWRGQQLWEGDRQGRRVSKLAPEREESWLSVLPREVNDQGAELLQGLGLVPGLPSQLQDARDIEGVLLQVGGIVELVAYLRSVGVPIARDRCQP